MATPKTMPTRACAAKGQGRRCARIPPSSATQLSESMAAMMPTHAVVSAAILVFAADYVLTSLFSAK